MISHILGNYEEAAAVLLFGIGFTTLLFHRNLIKKLIGMNIMDTGVFLLLASMGYIRGRKAPIIENGVTAVMLSLSVRLYKRYHTLDLDTIYVLSKHQKEDR